MSELPVAVTMWPWLSSANQSSITRSTLRRIGVLVAVQHLDRVEVEREAGARRAIAARVEAADVEVADLGVDARVVHVDDRVRRVRAHVAEEIVRRAAPCTSTAPCPARSRSRGQRERAEVAPAAGRHLVADRARDVAPDARARDERRVVGDDVVVGRHDQLDAVGDELVDAVVHRHARVGRARRVHVKVAPTASRGVDHVLAGARCTPRPSASIFTRRAAGCPTPGPRLTYTSYVPIGTARRRRRAADIMRL